MQGRDRPPGAPFLYLRGRSWRVQVVLVGLPLAVLVGIAALVEVVS